MNTKQLATLLACIALASCETLQKHPVMTAVLVGIAAGSIAASDSHRTQAHDVSLTNPNCSSGACR